MACAGTVLIVGDRQTAEKFQTVAPDCYYGLGADIHRRKIRGPLEALYIAISASARRGLNLVVDLDHTPPYLDGLDVYSGPPEQLYQRAMIEEPFARVVDRKVPRKPAERPGQVFMLAGTSSAGKSTLARALQQQRELLAYGLDVVYQMVPRRYLGIPLTREEIASPPDIPQGHLGVLNIPMEPRSDPPGPRMWQRIGPVLRNSASAQYGVLRELALAGYSVVSDQVFYYQDWYDEARRELEGIDVVWVDVQADPEALQKHEQTRGDRVLGVSLGLLDQMYKDIPFDISVHSGRQTPEQEAELVLAASTRSTTRGR